MESIKETIMILKITIILCNEKNEVIDTMVKKIEY